MISSNNPCSIPYLDCRGYFDLAADIITAVIAFMVLIRSLHNYRQLKIEQNNEHQPSYADTLRRKLIINLINVFYIFTFQAHLAFSMILFQVVNENGVQDIISMKLHLWYKFTQVFFVQFLNILLITVGWLYWKGLHSFYKIKEIAPPLHYNAKFQLAFLIPLIFAIAVTIVALITPLVYSQTFERVLDWLTVASEVISAAFFLIFRLLYYKNILCSVKLSKKSITKQKIHNLIILITSFGRIVLCFLSINNINFQSLRDFDEKSKCHDVQPYYGLVLLLIGVIIDLIPSFIFTRIFVTLQRQSGNTSQTLFSAGPSQYTVFTR